MRPIKYLLVGLIVTVVNWSIYIIGCHFGLPIILSNIFAFCTSTLISFLGNSLYTFSSEVSGKQFTKFILGRIGTGVILENIVLTILINLGLYQTIINIPAFYSKLIAVIISTLLNYFYCKFIFKLRK